LSTFIVFCEGLFAVGFYLLHIQKVWDCCQIYRNGGEKCNKKSPHWYGARKPMRAKSQAGLQVGTLPRGTEVLNNITGVVSVDPKN
jgi:hypothetical protein